MRVVHLLDSDDVKTAARKLASGKAVGVDGLPDRLLKEALQDDTVIYKLTLHFNRWLCTGKVPKHLKLARVVTLSKTDSKYPSVGDIRTIAILPAVFKLYETCVLKLLEQELASTTVSLHLRQRGFRPGKSFTDNLVDFMNFVRTAKEYY